MKKNIDNWLADYNQYHENFTNKLIHWICVPIIMLSLFGLLSLLDSGPTYYKITILNIFIFLSLLFYLRLSFSLSIGMLIISYLFILIIHTINSMIFMTKTLLFFSYISTFTIAWIGQFIGHKIEGKKPAFFKDLQFLLIGPLWLLSFIYKQFNIKI